MDDISHLRSLQHHERFISVHNHERTRITSTVEHHTVFRNRKGRKQQTVLSSRWHLRTTRSTSVCSAEVDQLTISVAQRHSWLPTVFVVLCWSHPSRSSSPWHPSHSSGSNHASQSSGSPGVFFGLDETCQRLCLTLSQAKWHLSQQRRQALRRVCFRSNARKVQQRVDRHQLELFLAKTLLVSATL